MGSRSADTDRLITEAAGLLHTRKFAFVAGAARSAAQKVARADVTVLSPEVFDSLTASLDVPDEAPELSDKLARLPRLPRLPR